ncbi:TetR/AcrR family transcriptional regulator [Rubellicoccus peritrichatus]|uniref:TetR/AcrR family transcriptional regulator n=1 Tax=Rubellicoccus peritrichatus TaxID=3080537 RepID=A0AAQ3LED2_9BACT|nr:TetR/AcrR family transcriptional regulator [Puniceicoccus sp. CR14]WOO42999.1 TetR/AcrR family transcriptional regulator [Puniceicoccus sp. CR14]
MGRQSDAKERLMRAMTDLIWERSYGSVTVDTICTKAEVKKGSFYHFFKSKADLMLATLDWAWEVEARPFFDEYFSPTLGGVERLRKVFEHAYRETVDTQKKYGRVLGCPYFNLGAEVSGVEPVVLNKIRYLLILYRRYFESAIRDAVAEGEVSNRDPERTARCLFSLYQGILTQSRIEDNPEIVRELSQHLDMVLGLEKATVAV